jgi:hypothetical protein
MAGRATKIFLKEHKEAVRGMATLYSGASSVCRNIGITSVKYT